MTISFAPFSSCLTAFSLSMRHRAETLQRGRGMLRLPERNHCSSVCVESHCRAHTCLFVNKRPCMQIPAIREQTPVRAKPACSRTNARACKTRLFANERQCRQNPFVHEQTPVSLCSISSPCPSCLGMRAERNIGNCVVRMGVSAKHCRQCVLTMLRLNDGCGGTA